MSRAGIERQRDDAYRALGRYVAEFSRLIYHMRNEMERRIERPYDPPALAHIVFGEMTAAPLATTFFALCKALGNLDAEEEAIRVHLMTEVVQKVVPERNDYLHGDWWIGWASQDAVDIITPAFTRTKAKLGEGQKWIEKSAADLDTRSDHLAALRNVVIEFGTICFGNHFFHTHPADDVRIALRVKDLFAISGPKKKQQVQRTGPLAERVPPLYLF